MNICNYGCGNEGKFKLSSGKFCCSEHHNSCPALRKSNSEGLKKAYKDGTLKGCCRFTDEHRKKSTAIQLQRSIEKAFRVGSGCSNLYLKKLLINQIKIDNKCGNCGLDEWKSVLLPLELDHIDGNSSNNIIENLRLLCPNCHSITTTWRGRSINKGKQKVSDKILLEALDKCKNIRLALMQVGLSPRGANYSRAYKLLNKQHEGLTN